MSDQVSRKEISEWLQGQMIGKPANNYTEGRYDAYNIVLREVERGRFDIPASEGEETLRAENESLKQQLKGIGIEQYYTVVSNGREQEKEIRRLGKALEKCQIGGNSLASVIIGWNLPDDHEKWTYAEASNYFYAKYPLDQDVAYQKYEVWLCWKSIREAGEMIESEHPNLLEG